MGKRAETKVLAGAAGTGLDNAPALKLVTSSKRQMILDGMLEAVGAEGYDRTSVRTVLDRTGVYRQAFYDNFVDKDECYMQALESGIDRFEAVVLAAASDETTWQGQLRAGLGALLDLLDADPDYGRGVIVEVHAAGPEALAKRTEAMKRAAGFIDRARASLGEDAPPSIAPEGVAAGIHSVVHARLAAGADGGFRELLPEFMYFAVMPYFGAEAANEAMQAASA
ncbi:MAG: TetR/AcrR family transcriptional regulator [Solirubrobacterales bacterium]